MLLFGLGYTCGWTTIDRHVLFLSVVFAPVRVFRFDTSFFSNRRLSQHLKRTPHTDDKRKMEEERDVDTTKKERLLVSISSILFMDPCFSPQSGSDTCDGYS